MGSAAYADTIKIGVIGPFSGPFALQGKNFKAGIDAYMAMHGNKVGDNEIEVIYRDVPTGRPCAIEILSARTGRQGSTCSTSPASISHRTPWPWHADPEAGQCTDGDHERRNFGDRRQEPARACAPLSRPGRPRRRSPRSRMTAASTKSSRSSATTARASMPKMPSRRASRRRGGQVVEADPHAVVDQ